VAAGLNDKFRKVGASTVTTLAAPGKALAASSINVGSTTNYPTDTGLVIAIRQVDTNGELVDGTYTEWNAIVTSATSLSIATTPRTGSDQVYPAGSTTQVFIVVSAAAHNDSIDGLLEEHNQDGTHSDITADSITAPEGTITDLTVTTLTVGSQTPTADWTALGSTPNTVTYNGNNSYSMVFNSTNYTGTVNPGTRLRMTRSASAPTQSTSLNGTSQYWVKTSPNKLTFTDDFVVSAWVKLSAYNGAANQVIASRWNGTSGFYLTVNNIGQILLVGTNAGSGNNSYVQSYQSIPINKWVHVSAQLDMSAFTATTTTSYVMINGLDAPATVIRSGTNPTALVQAGNLEIGSANGGTLPFNGKIAQVAIFNAKVTQATLQGYISQGLSGSETSLASAYSFNAVTTDVNTTTPNDLVAGGGSPTATNADSPFGGQASGSISATLDYGIVQSATFSTNTTLVVQVPEGNTIPTSGGLSAVSYSSQGAPYGFPKSSDKWQIVTLFKNQTSTTTSAGVVVNPSGLRATIPLGSWALGFSGSLFQENTSAAIFAPYGSLSISASALGDGQLTVDSINRFSGTGSTSFPVKAEKPLTLSSATTYYLVASTQIGGGTITVGYEGARATTTIYATNGYL